VDDWSHYHYRRREHCLGHLRCAFYRRRRRHQWFRLDQRSMTPMTTMTTMKSVQRAVDLAIRQRTAAARSHPTAPPSFKKIIMTITQGPTSVTIDEDPHHHKHKYP
jgi:hypothetical protein